MIRHPSSVIIAGPSGSGKSELVEQLLKERTLFEKPPRKIIYCYDRWQPRFDRMKRDCVFYKGIPPEGSLAKWFKPQDNGLLILDDLMAESGNDKRVLDLFTKDSHHRGITAFYLTQDLFPPGKYAKTINRNAHYVICFKSPRDKTGIRNLLYANADQINALSELVMNTLRGSIPTRCSTVCVLKPQPGALRRIANARNSIKTRRQLLQQQTGAGLWNELRRSYYSGKCLYQY